MRQYIWIFRQLFIAFVLIHNLYPLITIVNGRVIRKRDSYENVTLNNVNVTTEGSVIMKNITESIEIATEVTENIENTTEFSIKENTTPLLIARITANDMKALATTESADILTTGTITENLITTLGNVFGDGRTTTKLTIIERESTTEKLLDVDILTKKENVFEELVSKESRKQGVFGEITTADMIADETTTLGLLKFDHSKRSSDYNEHTSEGLNKGTEPEFKLTTINDDNQQSEQPEVITTTLLPLINSQTDVFDIGRNEETTTVREEKDNNNEADKELTKIAIITTTKTITETVPPLNISNSVRNNTENKKLRIDESTNYDVATNEIKNFTMISNNKTGGEKRPKQLKDSNMTLPDAPEVWALAGMKNGVKEINNLNSDGKLLNITVIDQDNALPEINSTGSTKLLADWTQIMKDVDINNNNSSNEKISPNSIENVLESENEKLKETSLSSLDPKKSYEKFEHKNQVISSVINPIHKSKENQTSAKVNTIISTSSVNTPTTHETEKTTPSVEKNQVEDADSEYISNKKIRIKNITRNGILKEEISKFPLPSTIIPEKVLPTLSTTPSPFAKIVQSTTQSQPSTTIKTTAIPQPVLTTASERRQDSTTESNFINKTFTTLSAFVNLVDATTFGQIASNSSSTYTVVNVSVRSTPESSISTTTESNKNLPHNQTINTEKENANSDTLASVDIKENSTEPVDSTTISLSSTNILNISTYSSPVSELSSITEINENISSSTESLLSITYATQIKPDIEYQTSSSTTEEYLKSSVTDESSTTDISEMRTSSTSGESLSGVSIESITAEGVDDQSTSATSKMSTTTFISPPPGRYDTTPGIITSMDDISTTTIFQNTPIKYSPHFVVESTTSTSTTTTMQSNIIPKIIDVTTEESMHSIYTSTHNPHVEGDGEGKEVEGGLMPPHPEDANNIPNETDYNVIIAISVSVVGIIALILLVGFLYVMRKRQKNLTYGQRCRPVSLDAYSLDNVSIYNSVRRKGALRASKRSYGNVAFDDPSLKHNVLSTHELSKFVEKKSTIYEEFKDVPQITARPDEVPQGCEDKNRYANVIPLPETRVILQQLNGDDKTEYINANYVRGPKDPPNYYIACQAPLESTVADFWRMIWEQNSRVIIQATDLVENGKEKCAEYLPPSLTIDNHVVYGDFQITLKNREVKDKYAVSTLHIKNTSTNTWREITHFWYQWPETGVPSDEAGVIAMLLEARSCLKIATQEQADDEEDAKSTTTTTNGDLPIEANGNIDKTKSLSKTQGPLTVHCSPGTGRTGTIISCDIALRSLEQPKRSVDIPQIVYYVRRGRASAVQTKEQYEFIYRVAHMYATKISGPINET